MMAWQIVGESLTITVLVAVMMVAIEYLNVWTRVDEDRDQVCRPRPERRQ